MMPTSCMKLRPSVPLSGGRRSVAPTMRLRPFHALALLIATLVIGFPHREDCAGTDSAPNPEGTGIPASDRGEREEAIEDLNKEERKLAERLLKDFPDGQDAMVFAAIVCRHCGHTAEAQECWKKCLLLNPNRADVLTQMGWVSMQKGDFGEAASRWRKALRLDPTLPGVHNDLARALMSMGRLDEARPVLEQGVELHPNDVTGRFLLGQVCLQMHDYSAARKHYEAAIQMRPDMTNAYYSLATVCSRLGDTEQAKVCRQRFRALKAEDLKMQREQNLTFDDLLETRRRVAGSHTVAGRVYATANRTQDAERLWLRAAELDPENVESRTNLALLYENTNRLEEALKTYEQLERIQPNNPIYAIGLGVIHAGLGHFEDSETAFRRAIELAPQVDVPNRELARLLLIRKQNLKEAKELAERAVALRSTAPNYYVLCLACSLNGDANGALSAIRRATELDPGNDEYQRILKALQINQGISDQQR